MSQYLPLHSDWTLRASADGEVPAGIRGRVVPATVPGCVHTDLLAHGLIPDPLVGRNEELLGWIGTTDWTYASTFQADLDSYERVDLVCAGLDTVAELRLNGETVGSTANMHRSYRFDVTGRIRPGGNDLAVTFASAVRYAEAMRAQVGPRPGAYAAPYNFIRKMACNFGWDWGPDLVTAGIWRQIGLEGWSTARLASVRPVVTVSEDGTGQVALHVDVERTAAGQDRELTVSLTVSRDDAVGVKAVLSLPAGVSQGVVVLEVAQADLWWPRGYGDQPLYDARLELTGAELTGTDAALGSWQRRIGFRTVELDTTPDADGVPFLIKINGQVVFVKGVNWIPDDVFVTRVDRARYDRRLDDACDAGVNLVRVWGGGLYESDAFYDSADERGLLVWQDFLFACAAYPEESPFAEEVTAEAREVVVRLASHASLALWNGNNENIWGFWDWDWQAKLDGRTWGAGYYFDLLPAIVAELDPTRPYWPGSPYSGDPSIHPNDPSRGPMHIWDVWNSRDYTCYRDYQARFVAEFGYQAPPSMATLTRTLDAVDLSPRSEAMLVHQKAADGNLKLDRGLEDHFGVPEDFDDWHFLTQLNQARALQLGIEHFRSLSPLCTGIVVWQLNDCWPAVSWAAVDVDGRRKPLWFALRAAYRDRLLTIQPRGADLVVAAANDTAAAWHGELVVQRMDFSGNVLARTSKPFGVGARQTTTIALAPDIAGAEDPKGELLVVSSGDTRALWFFEQDRHLAYARTSYEVSTEPVEGATQVHVRALTLLRDLCLFPDRLDPDAVVDKALVTLLPGESVTFTVRHGGSLTAAELTGPPVLRCVNDVLGLER